jgi:hypothetical protein
MQLDIFEHSRDVMLRNSVIDALRDRNAAVAARAIGELAAEYADDSMLPAFNLLCERLGLRVTGPLNRASASEALRATEGTIAAAARSVFGINAEGWLSPLWVELATAIKGLPFDARDEALHAVPFLLRAGRWADACACLESIPSWRRRPAPLAWKIEATARIAGMDPLWPLLAELSWMAPRRAEALIERVKMAELTPLVRSFNTEFEGEGTANDFAWFPAWLLIVHPGLRDRFHGAQAGANTPPERCARLVLELLAFERQGRHAMLVEGRKKLRDAHRMLFERYMQSRPASPIR